MQTSDREALKALIRQKDELEKEILDISEALSAENLGGASGALVDNEGYPRADIDIHLTRELRNKLAKLNFDHQAIMKKIEAGLIGSAGLPAAAQQQQPTGGGGAGGRGAPPPPSQPPSRPPPSQQPSPSSATGATPMVPVPSTGPSPLETMDVTDPTTEDAAALAALEPFALIDEVFADGPASSAGLQAGDRLLKFGNVEASNHDGLRALARLTQRSVGDWLPLFVLRAGDHGAMERVRLVLQPRRWAGQGLLGCHLRPL